MKKGCCHPILCDFPVEKILFPAALIVPPCDDVKSILNIDSAETSWVMLNFD